MFMYIRMIPSIMQNVSHRSRCEFDDTQRTSDMNTSTTMQSTKWPTNSGYQKAKKKESQDDLLMKRAIACMEEAGNRKQDDDVFGLFVTSELLYSDPQCKN